MSEKIVMTKGSWGDWNCVIESYSMEGVKEIKVGNPKGINLDREDLILEALRILGIEVEFRTSWYKTVTDESGSLRGERVDTVTSNMRK